MAFVLLASLPMQAQAPTQKPAPAPQAQRLLPSFDLHTAFPGAIAEGTATGRPTAAAGGPISPGPTREVDMNSLPKLNKLVAEPFEGYETDRRNGLTEDQYDELKRVAGARTAAGLIGAKPSMRAGTAKVRPAAPGSGSNGPLYVGPSTAFQAQGEIASCGGCVPPDMAVAAGTNFVVQFVNTAIAVYDKNGHLQSGFPKSATAFFGLPGGTYTSDPRMVYDWTYHRWIAVMLWETNVSSGTNTGYLLIAVSKTQDPRGAWNTWNMQIGSSGECPDYPTLGQDSNNWGPGATKGGFYVGINQFTGTGHCAGAGFNHSYIFMFPKDGYYSGSPAGGWWIGGFAANSTQLDTLQPANMTDRSDKPSAILMMNSYNMNFGGGACSVSSCNGVIVWTISGPTATPANPFAYLGGGSGPTVTGVNVATSHNYAFPPKASEAGCPATGTPCIDTNDVRIAGSVYYHAGSLFGSLNTGVSGTSPAVTGPLWFEVHPILNDTTGVITDGAIRQEDCFVCGGWPTNGSAWFAALQPDPENNLLMLFEYSDDASYPGAAVTSRRVTFGTGTMNGRGVYVQGGQANYYSARWGDYEATAPDLTIANRPLMWFAGMASDTSGYWKTVVGAVTYATPADQ